VKSFTRGEESSSPLKHGPLSFRSSPHCGIRHTAEMASAHRTSSLDVCSWSAVTPPAVTSVTTATGVLAGVHIRLTATRWKILSPSYHSAVIALSGSGTSPICPPFFSHDAEHPWMGTHDGPRLPNLSFRCARLEELVSRTRATRSNVAIGRRHRPWSLVPWWFRPEIWVRLACPRGLGRFGDVPITMIAQ
jgi:hypothetical protein